MEKQKDEDELLEEINCKADCSYSSIAGTIIRQLFKNTSVYSDHIFCYPAHYIIHRKRVCISFVDTFKKDSKKSR